MLTPKAVDDAGRPLKMNEGKVDLSLVHPLILRGMARPYEYGLTKYHRDSWRKFTLDEARELIASAMRHIDAYREGHYFDMESGLPHLTMAMFNLGTIYWHETKGGKLEKIKPRPADTGEAISADIRGFVDRAFGAGDENLNVTTEPSRDTHARRRAVREVLHQTP